MAATVSSMAVTCATAVSAVQNSVAFRTADTAVARVPAAESRAGVTASSGGSAGEFPSAASNCVCRAKSTIAVSSQSG